MTTRGRKPGCEIDAFVSHALLDTVRGKFGIKSDRALSKALGLTPPTISKIRRGRKPVSAETVLRVHDVTGWSIGFIKALLPEGAQPR